MLHIEEGTSSEADVEKDTEWHTLLELKIAPHPNLSESQRKVIELDFGMNNGIVVLPVRQALAEYTLEYMGLSLLNPSSQEVVLANKEEVKQSLQLEQMN